ncbi:hypothetical protein VTK26DRAFT_7081 [Humicola hyalothermophila]
MVMIAFLLSAILGAIVVAKHPKKDRRDRRARTQTTQIGHHIPIDTGHEGVTDTAPTGPSRTTQPGQVPASYV